MVVRQLVGLLNSQQLASIIEVTARTVFRCLLATFGGAKQIAFSGEKPGAASF
jgi:hypothetical protein